MEKTTITSKYRQSLRSTMENYSCKPSINRSFIKKDGTASIFLLIYINKKKHTIPLGISWPSLFFDDNSGLLKPINKKDQQYLDYNLIISAEQAKVHKIFTRFRLMEKVLTLTDFKLEYNGVTVKKDFIAYYEHAMSKRCRNREITLATKKTQTTTLNSLQRFKQVIPFNQLGKDLMKQYILFLRKNGLSENTIWARVKDFKTYMNIARRDDVNFEWPFEKMLPNEKPKYRNTQKTYLNKAELIELYTLLKSEQLNDFQQTILAKYLFSCVTGLRISDSKNLENIEIIANELVFIMQKNKRILGKIVKVPLSKMALELLKNHKEALFRIYSDPAVNRELKIIALSTSIKKNVTFHTSRHTFATMFLELGGSVEVLSEILGHSNIKTTMVYVHISGQNRKRQIALMDNVLLP